MRYAHGSSSIKRRRGRCETTSETIAVSPLFGIRLFVARGLLRGCKLLDGLLQLGQARFERHDLVFRGLEPLRSLERTLHGEALQKVDIALKAAGSLVQPGRFCAVLYPRYVLRSRGIHSDAD